MPGEMRQAVHSAVQAAPAAAAAPPPVLDVYRREADALLVPGLTRDAALQHVARRMGLEIVESTQDSPVVLWAIEHSSKYNYLEAHFEHGMLDRWSLRVIHGAKGV